MAVQTLTLKHTAASSGPRGAPLTGTTKSGRSKLRDFAHLAKGMAAGFFGRGTSVAYAGAAQAAGTLTLSTASGTVGGTINGVAVTVTASGGDTATAAAIAAAINASTNPLVSQHATATSSGAVVTVTALHAGSAGNAVTLAASGTGVTASGVRLTGGDYTAINL